MWLYCRKFQRLQNSADHGYEQIQGSTIDIGAVYGVGFVTRAELEEDFNAIRFMFDSVEEHELHTLFAEAVVSGRQVLTKYQNGEQHEKTVIEMADVELSDRLPTQSSSWRARRAAELVAKCAVPRKPLPRT